jgi:hypothetical protein
MNRIGVPAAFGTAGFFLGWFTRPLVELRASSLTVQELASHLQGDLDPLLGQTARHTFLHIGLFGLACIGLGYVVARLANP